MPRFFVDLPLSPGAKIELPPVPAHHAARVLRLVKGAEVVLFNGQGGEYPAVLEWVDRDGVTALCREWRDVERESSLDIRLAQGISGGERMDYTLQKAVELGVASIQPVMMKRTIVRLDEDKRAKRRQHWQGVVASACEQCGRNHLPGVAPILDFHDWLGEPAARAGIRLLLDPEARLRLRELPAPSGPVTLVAGPEGGFDPFEREALGRLGFRSLSLGPRILRTETAAMTALAAMQALWGDI